MLPATDQGNLTMVEKTIKVLQPDRVDYGQLGFWERSYLPEILRGLSVTAAHFARAFVGYVFGKRGGSTIQYPDQTLSHAPRYRGKHILAQREDGTPRCVACYMCATACPAKCIHIVAGDHPDPHIEKYPVRFDLDLARCVFCGFCEEACPCEAIYLTDTFEDMPQDNFTDLILTKEKLLGRDQSLVARKKAILGG